jgi:hypothetical protein
VSKREKVIVILMIVAIAYGIYDFFLASPSKPIETFDAAMELEELDKLRSHVTGELAKEKISGTEDYVITQAERDWQKDPFLQMKVPQVKPSIKAEAMRVAVDFKYSGFVELGAKRTAVINGMEYQTGDELDPGGYMLREISPKRVVIEVRGKGQKIIVPLAEELL